LLNPGVRYDDLIVGGGTAGCVLAARLSEDTGRSVCLVEAGPDYGPIEQGRWPEEMVTARSMPASHDWGIGADDERSLGARIIGGCSAHNACCVLAGAPDDYDAWGAEWSYDAFQPYLARAMAGLRTAKANTDRPALFHSAFLEAALALGFPLLTDPNDPAQAVGVAPFPANVVGGSRWNTAFGYLDAARERPKLTILPDTLVDRVLLEGTRATGVLTDRGRLEAERVTLAAGAYFSAAILLRSGIGPEEQLGALGIPVTAVLPVGERLLDHYGAALAWEPTEQLHRELAMLEPLFEAHVMLKATSSLRPPGSLDLHLPSWVSRRAGEPGRFDVRVAFFLMQPASSGRVRLRSTNAGDLPLVEAGFLSEPADLPVLLEGLELGRRVAATEPMRSLIEAELRPGPVEPVSFLQERVSTYYHPVGTCPIGSVVDARGSVVGIENLIVADASIMPSIPRANPNLTVVAIAERVADLLCSSVSAPAVEPIPAPAAGRRP
jgi:choline dehydrogenase